MGELQAQVVNPDGVTTVPLEQQPDGTWTNRDVVTLHSGGFVTIPEAGYYTLTLRSWDPPPGVLDFYLPDEPDV